MRDGGREVYVALRVQDLLGGQAAGGHHQGHVAHHLGGRGDLDDVAEQLVDLGVGLLDLDPVLFQPQGASLLTQVGVLTAGHTMLEDRRGARAHVALESRVLAPHAFPIAIDVAQHLAVEAGVAGPAAQGLDDGAQVRLRGEAAP